MAAYCGVLWAFAFVVPGRLMAQAPPGPMAAPPQSQSTSSRPVAAKPKPPVIQSRTTLDGAWRLNHDESDDPRSKAKIKERRGPDMGNGRGGYPGGGGNPGGGYPGGGYPPFPGAGGGGPPRGSRGQEDQYDEKLLEAIRPSSTLTFALKNAEVDATDDQSRKLVFYTDGRQLQKPKDDSYQEIAAHWNGSKLETDEKSPQGAKMVRTFELSQNGQQLYQTLHIDALKNKPAVYVQYVFDIPPPQATHETDPDQPVMRRRADNSDTASPQGAPTGAGSDSDQPVMKRRSDDSDSTSNPQGTPTGGSTASPQPPDPDQPVMKRRSENSSSQ